MFVFARHFSSEIVGTLTLLIVTVEVLSILVTNNTPAVTRIDFFKLEDSTLEKQLNVQFFNSLIVSLFLFFIITPILIYKDVSNYFYILLLVPFLRSFNATSLALLQCNKQTNKYLIAQLVFSFSYLIIFITCYKYGISSWVIALTISLLLQFLYLKKTNSFILLKKPSFISGPDRIEIALKGIAFMPQAIGWWLRSGAERYLIALYLGVGILGQYALSIQISAIAVLFITAINLAIVPEINRRLSKGTTEDVSKVNRIYLFTFLLLFFAILVLWVGGYGYLSTYYHDYTISKDILWIACLSTLFQSFSMILMNELYFRDRALLVAKYVLSCFLLQAMLQLIILGMFQSLYTVLFVNVTFSIILFILVIRKLVLERENS